MFSFKRLIRLSYFIVATRADGLFPDYYWLLNIVLTSHIVLVYGRSMSYWYSKYSMREANAHPQSNLQFTVQLPIYVYWELFVLKISKTKVD